MKQSGKKGMAHLGIIAVLVTIIALVVGIVIYLIISDFIPTGPMTPLPFV